MKKKPIYILFILFLISETSMAIEPVYDGDDGVRSQVFATNCLFCHSTELSGGDRNGAPEGVNFDTFTDAANNGSRAVARAVTQMDMPPSFSQLPLLTDEQKQALSNWQNLEFPENTVPASYSVNSQTLVIPAVTIFDSEGNVISEKVSAEMRLIDGSDPLQFEITNIGDAQR